MKSLWIKDAGVVEVRTLPDPVPEGEEVVVRVEAAAICGSDLHGLYEKPGEKAWVPGHEASGVVVGVDRRCPNRFREGDRVVCTAFWSCGGCELCRAGYVAYCANKRGTYGFGLHGMQAELVRVSASTLLPLPEHMSFEEGCLVIDPVGTPYHASRRMGTNAAHVVGVFGLGPMGLGAVLVSAFLGAHVIAVDPVGYRRELAARLGASMAVDPSVGDVVAQIRELTGGYGMDRALECSGRPEPLGAALDLVRPLGQVSIIGENPNATISPSDHFNRKEISLSGSTCFPLGEYGAITRLFGRGLRARELITHRFPVDRGAEAYRTFASGRSGKVVILPHEGA